MQEKQDLSESSNCLVVFVKTQDPIFSQVERLLDEQRVNNERKAREE